MSRVEPKDERRHETRRQADRDPDREPADGKPSQAEGEEETVNEALKRQQ